MASALITGGTSGIGHAFARELAGRGTDLILVARDTDRLRSVAAELTEAHGVDVEIITADLAVREDALRVAARLEDPSRPVDLLVNNAGFGLHTTLLDPADIDVHARALDVMCLAVLILGGAAARSMKARGHGRIITVSSTAGTIFTGNYSAVKAWATTYSQALGVELRGTGVTSTALCPGWVRTEFHERAGIKATSLPSIVWIDAETLVRGALADAEKGRYISVPTLKWKIAYFIAEYGPRAFTRWFSRKLSASRKRH
ncbi:short-chain dehydrogenase [Tessaracoccus lapidicaptus]|uniref:Short-chain dehydrogenase n=1 Tax=Tessaracoccus lapidicaptus TaxID=1427523 RepID=A0A1C0AIQ3_9ACTN|nr:MULTISPECIES: SDR family NAD(P)-dependent oxidoreductase [Tessaracoccus]AQX15709.1 short-chain dehydrogenase [Tessaracoccus sp. T2.5-30]OCL31989.1 short-chain dehydrogenase [Tessaracoccus lapidicaptus]VEP40105.1 Putative ketoacyl reductase [Tessaracoccus lapidicaptus]